MLNVYGRVINLRHIFVYYGTCNFIVIYLYQSNYVTEYLLDNKGGFYMWILICFHTSQDIWYGRPFICWFLTTTHGLNSILCYYIQTILTRGYYVDVKGDNCHSWIFLNFLKELWPFTPKESDFFLKYCIQRGSIHNGQRREKIQDHILVASYYTSNNAWIDSI